MLREPLASASRRLATPSRSTTTSSLLATLDSLDLNATTGVKVDDPRVNRAEMSSGVVAPSSLNNAEQKKSSVERLGTRRVEMKTPSFLQKSTASSIRVTEAMYPNLPPTITTNQKLEKGTRGVRTSKALPQTHPVVSLDAKAAVAQDTLPIYSYKDYQSPKAYIVYTRHEEETNDLIAGIRPGPIAMDMEWRVDFFRQPGLNSSVQRERKTAVVQIADGAGLILVIQINNMRRFPIRLQALIENPDVVKVGVNILNDGKKLFRDYGIRARNLVELGAVALVVDPSPVYNRKIVSLAKLVEHYCRKTLLKGDERTSDWENLLNPEQREYAANDVHSSLMVYKELMKLSGMPSSSIDCAKYTSEVTWNLGSKLISGSGLQNPNQEGMRPQYMRAYQCWHQNKLTLDEMCLKLSLKDKGYYGSNQQEGGSMALKPGTVISYIISALQNDCKLEYKLDRLVEVVQMDLNSWSRHSHWITMQYHLQNQL